MSGVLYGLLGFIYTYKKLHPEYSYTIPKADIILMVIWFFLCLFNILPQIANMAHAGGLSAGILIGALMNFSFKKEELKHVGIGLFFLFITIMVEAYRLNGQFYIHQFFVH